MCILNWGELLTTYIKYYLEIEPVIDTIRAELGWACCISGFSDSVLWLNSLHIYLMFAFFFICSLRCYWVW
jgi:hypothetical protein